MGGGIPESRHLSPMRFSRTGRTVDGTMLNFREELLREQRRALERRLSLAYPPRERRRSEPWWKRDHRRDCDSHSPENDGSPARLPPQWPASSPR